MINRLEDRVYCSHSRVRPSSIGCTANNPPEPRRRNADRNRPELVRSRWRDASAPDPGLSSYVLTHVRLAPLAEQPSDALSSTVNRSPRIRNSVLRWPTATSSETRGPDRGGERAVTDSGQNTIGTAGQEGHRVSRSRGRRSPCNGSTAPVRNAREAGRSNALMNNGSRSRHSRGDTARDGPAAAGRHGRSAHGQARCRRRASAARGACGRRSCGKCRSRLSSVSMIDLGDRQAREPLVVGRDHVPRARRACWWRAIASS